MKDQKTRQNQGIPQGPEGKKILVLSPGYPRWKGDFTHPMVFNVSRLLRGAGHCIKVVTIHYPKTPTYEEIDGVNVIRARYAPDHYEILGSEGGLVDDIRDSWLCRFLVVPMLISLAWQTLKQARSSDLLLVQWIPTTVAALPAKLIWRKPMILHSRTYPDTPFWRLVYRFLLPFADGVIYNSSDNCRLTNKLYKHSNTTVIGSGINLKQFTRPTNANRKCDEWQIVTVARLVEFKGVEYAIKALAKLKLRGRRAHLNIVGDGPLRKELHILSRKLDVEDNVTFCGALAHDRIQEKLWESDLFLISSIIDSVGRTEGFGAVILEAMAAQLPVVASAVGGITDIVDGDNGLLVPEKNPEAIADAIEQMLSDRSISKGFTTRGLKFVTAVYSDEAIVEKFHKFFASLGNETILE